MTMGSIGGLDNIVNDLSKFSHLYLNPKFKSEDFEKKSKDGIILISSIDEINLKKGYYKQSGVLLSAENMYFEQLKKSRGYDSFSQEGYIFVPPGIRVERLAQKDIGYGILGTASLSGRVIQVLETLYGKEFEEVLLHETLHIQNWDKPESWVRYETKHRFEKMFDTSTTFH